MEAGSVFPSFGFYASKKGHMRRNWKRRWFQCEPSTQTISYWKSEKDCRASKQSAKKGEIRVSTVAAIADDELAIVNTSRKTYFVKLENVSDASKVASQFGIPPLQRRIPVADMPGVVAPAGSPVHEISLVHSLTDKTQVYEQQNTRNADEKRLTKTCGRSSVGDPQAQKQHIYDLQSGWAANAPGLQSLQRAREHLEGGTDVLFVIRRSSNQNIVVYTGAPGDGVNVKWIMFDKSGAPTEELTYLEKNTAYGTVVKRVSAAPSAGSSAEVLEQYEVVLSALKDRVITVRLEADSTTSVRKSRWCATTTIGDSSEVELQAVYVCLAKSMVPSVAYVELFGVGAYELIEKSRGSGSEAQERSMGLLGSMKKELKLLETAEDGGAGGSDGVGDVVGVGHVVLSVASPKQISKALQEVERATKKLVSYFLFVFQLGSVTAMIVLFPPSRHLLIKSLRK
jgi:hypothetical protein